MTRTLSHSEITTALTCEAQHDFRYVGQLAGTALASKAATPKMRQGRAWGRAAAAYHANQLAVDGPVLGHQALDEALDEDAAEQRAAGLYLADEHIEMAGRLHAMLDHYIATTSPLLIDRVEHELQVAIPSRTGRGKSNRYRFEAYLDGIHTDDQGRPWLVEYKLRGRLTSFELIALDRQTRWYAWAWHQETGVEVAGVIVDERLNEIPKPARVNKGRGKDPIPVASHAVDQLTTPELYLAACENTGEQPNEDTVAALASRRWSARHPIIFRAGELDEAGRQLVSAAQLIRDLDTAVRYPIRNPGPARCPGCPFRDICGDPGETDLVDSLFDRRPAKKDRDRPADGEVELVLS